MGAHKLTFRVLLLLGLMLPGENGALANGQILHAGRERPSFEVATIKPWKRTTGAPPDGANLPGAAAPGRVKVAPLDAAPRPADQVHLRSEEHTSELQSRR